MTVEGPIVLAMTGASGAPYAIRLLQVLCRAGRTVHLTISTSGAQVLREEVGLSVALDRFDLAAFGVRFDAYFLESSLYSSGRVEATVARLVDQHKGGQVIDLRPGSPRPVYRSRDVVHGLVVVITHSGVVRVEVLEPQGMFGTVCKSLVSALPELTGAGAAEVVRKIDGDHGGDGVSVTVEDPDGPSTP